MTWEEKAKANPLYAVMSSVDFENKTGSDIGEDDLDVFFNKGELLFAAHFRPLLGHLGFLGEGRLAIEYGCGMGRLMRQFMAAGMKVAGIDISETMLEHARRLVPGSEGLHLLNSSSTTELPSGCADFVYSYAVLQHINRLSNFVAAVNEICRLVKPGGWLKIQFNADDSPFNRLDPATNLLIEPHEDHVIRRWPAFPNRAPERRDFNHWSGTDASFPFLQKLLNERGIEITGYEHYPPKPRACWLTGRRPA